MTLRSPDAHTAFFPMPHSAWGDAAAPTWEHTPCPADLTPPHHPQTFSWATFQKGRDTRAGRGDPHVLPTLFLVTPPFLLSRGHTV